MAVLGDLVSAGTAGAVPTPCSDMRSVFDFQKKKKKKKWSSVMPEKA